MKTHTLNGTGASAGRNPELLNIALVHDNHAAAKAAEQLTRNIVARTIADVDIHFDNFSFTELRHATCAAEALELAAGAEIFVLATINAGELPSTFHVWFAEFLTQRRGKETLIICLIGSADGTTRGGAVADFLARAAFAEGHDFLMSGFTAPAQRAPFPQCPTWERWGINE